MHDNRPSTIEYRLFGTDGIRGTPGEYPLTDEMISRIARALAQSLLFKRATKRKVRIIIGRDTRLSGKKIERILMDNIRVFGIDVLIAGTITTPGLSFLTKDLLAVAGIMISASHNRAIDNGLKFFNTKGHKFSHKQEQQIEEIVLSDLSGLPRPAIRKRKGRIYTVKDAHEKYVKFLVSTVKGLDLKGMKIALDCAWGAASFFAKEILTKLGARVYSIHDKPSGDNINVGGAVNPALLKELVLESEADIGIAVDGDGDRGILVDEKGQILDGDYTMAAIARHLLQKNRLPQRKIVATVMSNYGLRASIEKHGGKIITTDVGDKFVLESLLRHNLSLGGEQSGHIIFLDYLPTPDGLLTALQMLNVMRETNSRLSQLCECLTKFPQVLVNVKVRERRPFEEMPAVDKKLKYFTNRLKNKGRVLLRYSGTEPLARIMVEGINKDLIEEIANSLAEEIKREIGVKD